MHNPQIDFASKQYVREELAQAPTLSTSPFFPRFELISLTNVYAEVELAAAFTFPKFVQLA